MNIEGISSQQLNRYIYRAYWVDITSMFKFDELRLLHIRNFGDYFEYNIAYR